MATIYIHEAKERESVRVHPVPDSVQWLEFVRDDTRVCVEMTDAQLERLYYMLGQHLNERDAKDNDKTTCTGDEVLAVIGDDTVTADQLRSMITGKGPVGESELLARHAAQTAPHDAELRRRSGLAPDECGHSAGGEFCVLECGHSGPHEMYPF